MVINDSHLPYRDPSLGTSERVSDLLGRMTLDEKLGQLGSAWVFQIINNDGLDLDRASTILKDGIGHITRVSGASSFGATQAAAVANDIQNHLIQNTRHGIPAIIHEEICSGLMAREATVFPQALGVAATFNPALNQELADSVRSQMRAMGSHQGLSPVLDVCRDPRWGRTEETYGEDPLLVSQMGMSFIAGLQGSGDERSLRQGVVATAKHFVGYGASQGGLNWAPAHIPERELRDVYLRPFEAAVREVGLASVMNGYHELDGIPCAANSWLLNDVLREEWGFTGTVVADYFAIKQLAEYHHVVGTLQEAAVTTLTAGIDVELPSTECYGTELAGAVDSGAIAIGIIDQAVGRVLATKFDLGLFETPLVELDAVGASTRTDQQIELSHELASQSLVLLRNEGSLPLKIGTKTVAVIGPNASSARHMLGDYSYITHVESLVEVLKSGDNVFAIPVEHDVDIAAEANLDHIATILDALTASLPDSTVAYAKGCEIVGEDRSGFAEAVRIAQQSDVAVMVMGERSGLTQDCTTGESRDVASLSLSGVQEDLVHAVAATGTPVVLVLIAGRPVGSPAVHAAADAVVMAWLPGEQGGPAVADVLTGATNPGGKLPISYPRSSGQIPIYYSHKVSGGRSHWKGPYVDESNEPLYPFGFGLSYSQFEVLPTTLTPTRVGAGGSVQISATVTNTGSVAGDEVVQLYGRDPVASITRPVRELLAFERVRLQPQQQLCITFEVPIASMGFAGVDLACVIESGEVDFFVGVSAVDTSAAGSVMIEGSGPTPVVRASTFSTTIEEL